MLLVSIATVGLWCANGALTDVFGEMGIIAILPMVAFFGFGVLGKARTCPHLQSTSRLSKWFAMRAVMMPVASVCFSRLQKCYGAHGCLILFL